ncbi:tape measure protein [Vreelandella venusta]|uniref:tape measure protein n=1 Tax=Vreelandella venusta TaxID=44935 RepID=UPI003AA83BA8
MATDVGSIYYTVDARTAALLDAERQVDRSTKRMDRAFGNTDSTVRQLNETMGQLKTTVIAVSAAMGVQQVYRYADAWTNLQNQLRQVTRTELERARVTERLMTIANDTRSGISSTANLYARLTRATTELGLSEERRLKITRTINQAFATSGATAQEAEAAITQLSQGLASGTLRGDEFNSVAEQAPAIMRAIADEANMTIGELREFASTGGITADLVVRSLEGVADAMETNFAKAAASFGQNLAVADNNLTQFIGTNSNVSSAVNASGQSIIFLSENLGTIVELAKVAAAVYGTRLVTGIGAATTAWVRDQVALQANLKAGVDHYKQLQRRTAAEHQTARSLLSTAKLEAQATKGTAAHTFALQQLSVARVRAAEATAAHTAATNAYTAATARANVVTRALRISMGALGGPVGVAMLGAFAIYELTSASRDASPAMDTLAQSTDQFTESLREMTKVQANAALIRLNDQLDDTRDNLRDAERDISRLEGVLAGNSPRAIDDKSRVRYEEELAFALERRERLQGELNTGQERANQLQAVSNGEVSEGTRSSQDNARALRESAEAWEEYSQKLIEARNLVGATAQQEAEYRAQQEGFTATQVKIAGLIAAQTEAMRNYQAAIADGDSEEASAHINQAQRYAEKQAMLEQQLSSLNTANALLANVQTNLSAVAVAAATNVGAGAEASARRVQEILASLQAQAANIRVNTVVSTDSDGSGAKDRAAEQAKRETERIKQEMERRRQAVVSALQSESEAAFSEYQRRNVEIQSLFEEGSAQQRDLLSRNNESYLKTIQELHAREKEEVLRHQEEMAQQRKEDYTKRLQEITGFSDQAVQKLLEIQKNAGDPMAALTRNLGDAFVNLDDTIASAFMNGMQNAEGMNDILKSIGQTVLGSLLKSFIKLGVQMLVNAAMGEAAGTAAAAASMAQGQAVLAAWSPAAIAVNTATFGAASGVGLASYLSAQAAGAMASLAGGAKGFASGGYTGAGARNEPAGIVHRGEYVMPKHIVDQPGMRQTLEAMRRGEGPTRQYLELGSSSGVASNRDMQAMGSGGVTVNLIGQGADSAQVEQYQGLDGQQVIDILLADAYNNGPVRQAIRNTEY